MDDYRRPEASEHYERAMALERVGRIDEALAEYRRAVDADPGFADAYEALGYHYQQRGLLIKALDAFQTVARLEGHYSAYFNTGYILVELEHYEEALEAFQECLALAPGDASALYEIGYIYYVLGDLPRALEALRRPLEAMGEDWRVHNLIGACNLGLQRWEEAEESYRRAAELATSAEELEEAQAGLQVAQRYRTFEPGASMGFKDWAYADTGTVVLGTLGDDGLRIVPRDHLTLSSEAIAVTLRRLQALVGALGLSLSAVVAVDRASIPLAMALEEILSVPRKQLSRLDPGDRALLVLLAGRQAELLQVALEQAPRGSLTFVFALEWYREHELLPDLIGVPVGKGGIQSSGELPRGEGELQVLAEVLLTAHAELPAEPNLAAQVRYYTVKHRQLRFL